MAKKIAITGGIGSGKSLVAEMLRSMGYPVFSCDEIYKEIIESSVYVQKIKENFPEVIDDNGAINKKRLAERVFSDTESRKTLNALAHPLIMEKLLFYMNESTENLVFAEVPLLFEGDYQNLFDYILVLIRPIPERMKAVQLRDGISQKEIIRRMDAQFDYTSKQACKYLEQSNVTVIENNGDKNNLKTAVIHWLNNLS